MLEHVHVLLELVYLAKARKERVDRRRLLLTDRGGRQFKGLHHQLGAHLTMTLVDVLVTRAQQVDAILGRVLLDSIVLLLEPVLEGSAQKEHGQLLVLHVVSVRASLDQRQVKVKNVVVRACRKTIDEKALYFVALVGA